MDRQKLYEFMLIKAGLLSEGIYFPEEILNELREKGLIMPDGTGLFRYGRKDSPNEMIIIFKDETYRVEVRPLFNNDKSNFVLHKENGGFFIEDRLTGVKLSVQFPLLPSYMAERTKNNVLMGTVMKPMGINWLRIYPDMRCDFAQKLEARCGFCGGIYKKADYGLDDIEETIERAQKDMSISGIFMSTGAFKDKKRIEFYAEVIKTIRKLLPSEIIFSLAPQINDECVRILYKAGSPNISLSYNLEVFDDSRWDTQDVNCLGIAKATLGKEFYMKAYDIAIKIGGRGNHKSNFVIGLESLDSLRNGVSNLSQIGVISSGTVYYPTPGSLWEKMMKTDKNFYPLVSEFKDSLTRRQFIVDSYIIMAQVMAAYKLKPSWDRTSRISGLEWQAYDYLNK